MCYTVKTEIFKENEKVVHYEQLLLKKNKLMNHIHGFPESKAFMNSSSVKDSICAASKCICSHKVLLSFFFSFFFLRKTWTQYRCKIKILTFCLLRMSINFSCFLNPTTSSAFCFLRIWFSASRFSLLCSSLILS